MMESLIADGAAADKTYVPGQCYSWKYEMMRRLKMKLQWLHEIRFIRKGETARLQVRRAEK